MTSLKESNIIILIIIGMILIGATGGYFEGKHQADKYYQANPPITRTEVFYWDSPSKPTSLPERKPKTCGKGWDEEVKGTCSVILPGYITPQANPKHKGIICHFAADLYETLYIYNLEDQ